jgi:hypothetical protein
MHGHWTGYRMTRKAKFGVMIIAILAIAASWWWMRPGPESLTQRLWRECHDTLAYTHPEWNESHLDMMTKRCMDQRLLGQGAR